MLAFDKHGKLLTKLKRALKTEGRELFFLNPMLPVEKTCSHAIRVKRRIRVRYQSYRQ